MLRFIFIFLAIVALVALFTRNPGPRRVLYFTLGLMVLYTILKLTGVVDALAPDRMGIY